MYADWPLLSLVIWTPIVGGILVLIAGDEKPAAARKIALLFSIVTFLLSLPLYSQFNTDTHLMQFVQRDSWIPAFNIEYFVGIDGISMPLILLTSFTTVVVIIPDHGRFHDRYLFGSGRNTVLCLFRGNANPDVPGDRYLGWYESNLCDPEVFPLHLYWFGNDPGSVDLHVQ
jgi:formate hydrogenlyase subunit 3/multisubunit Na+/H+ antiporter MnhD subunit